MGFRVIYMVEKVFGIVELYIEILFMISFLLLFVWDLVLKWLYNVVNF